MYKLFGFLVLLKKCLNKPLDYLYDMKKRDLEKRNERSILMTVVISLVKSLAIVTFLFAVYTFYSGSCYEINAKIDSEIMQVNSMSYEINDAFLFANRYLEMEEGYLKGKDIPADRMIITTIDSALSTGLVKNEILSTNLLKLRRGSNKVNLVLEYGTNLISNNRSVSKIMGEMMEILREIKKEVPSLLSMLDKYKKELDNQRPRYCIFRKNNKGKF